MKSRLGSGETEENNMELSLLANRIESELPDGYDVGHSDGVIEGYFRPVPGGVPEKGFRVVETDAGMFHAEFGRVCSECGGIEDPKTVHAVDARVVSWLSGCALNAFPEEPR